MKHDIAVLGASGQIGRFLLPKLCSAGKSVLALSRHAPSSDDAANPAWLRADLHAEMPALDQIETLISLGPLDALVAWLQRDRPAALHRIIAFSSMSAESKRESLDPAERELAARLHDSEQQLLALGHAHDIAITIFRPTLIYGAGLDRSLTPLARFASRWHVLPIPLAATGLRQPVHAEDLADACIAVLDCPLSFGKIYPLGGGEQLSFRAVCWRIGAGLPKNVLPLPLPSWLLRAALLLRGNAKFGAVSVTSITRLRHDLVADNSAAAHDFGYRPRSFYPLAASWGLPAV
ncbi:hypothetical protein ELE36_17750 [Pseudolysobacter antarcticus]|uniref:NAD-dependent epimerase/dehydratase domain-containing protein n=1 Tax=Pseudolysobacter antarcticus TaxID=2511995 RepID=A0A411HNK4_9GAMM|nr:NAD-dependent epimerase/dehydratase family protein [Pseudolysobacter antarcticus]QBB72061.1 hypothetical protein ELE36_17750 [Pseudolysobacter antarcticus]